MSELIIDGNILKEFMKIKKFKRCNNYNSRKEVKEKVKEIALTYYDEMTPMEYDGTSDYKPEIEFVNYCYSNNNTIGWDLVFIGMALLNFEISLAETFNIKEEVIEKIMEDYNSSFDDRFNYLIDSIYYNLNSNSNKN